MKKNQEQNKTTKQKPQNPNPRKLKKKKILRNVLNHLAVFIFLMLTTRTKKPGKAS